MSGKLLLKDTFRYGILTGVSASVGFLLLPLLTRAYSAGDFGALDIAITLSTLMSLLFGISQPASFARYYQKNDLTHQRALMASSLSVTVLFSVLGVLGTAILAPFLGPMAFGQTAHSTSFLILTAVTGGIMGLTAVPRMALRMQRRVLAYNALDVVYSVAYCVLTIAAIRYKAGIVTVMLANTIATSLRLTIALWLCRDLLRGKPSRAILKPCLRYGGPRLPASIFSWTCGKLGRFLVLSLLGLSSVGLYAAASRIASTVSLLSAMFQLAWTPHAMALVQKPEELRNSSFFQGTVSAFLGVFSVVALTVSALGPLLLYWFLPSDYEQCYRLIPWLAAAAFLSDAYGLLSIGIDLSERTEYMSICVGFGAFMSVASSVILSTFWGLDGIAIGVFVGSTLECLALVWTSRRVGNVAFPTSRMFCILAIYIVAGGFFSISPWTTLQRAVVWLLSVVALLLATVSPAQRQELLKFARARARNAKP